MKPSPTRDLLGRLAAARPLVELVSMLREKHAATAAGLWGSSVAAVTAILQRELGRPVLLVCGHIDEADDLADDFHLFAGARPDVLPALELSGALGHQSEEQVANRMQLITRLNSGLRTGHSGLRTLQIGQPRTRPHPHPHH